MSKDPAFLFYSNDFLSGTFTMSDEQVGKYIRLLCIQHQKSDGLLTEKDMLNICKTYDLDIVCKFSVTDDGKYYNDRLKQEVDRRKLYSKSRSDNRKSKKINTFLDEDMKNICLSCVKHMETETETINSICLSCYDKSNYKKKKSEKQFIKPTIEEVKKYFTDNGYTEQAAIRSFNHYDLADWKDAYGKQVLNWKQKIHTNWFKSENKAKIIERIEFYRTELEKSNFDKSYSKFIDYIHGDNPPVNKPMINILSVPDQLTYLQYLDIKKRMNGGLAVTLDKINGKDKYTNESNSLYTVIETFIENEK